MLKLAQWHGRGAYVFRNCKGGVLWLTHCRAIVWAFARRLLISMRSVAFIGLQTPRLTKEGLAEKSKWPPLLSPREERGRSGAQKHAFPSVKIREIRAIRVDRKSVV